MSATPALMVTVTCIDCGNDRQRQWQYEWQTDRCLSCAKLHQFALKRQRSWWQGWWTRAGTFGTFVLLCLVMSLDAMALGADLVAFHSTYAGTDDNDQELIFSDPGFELRVGGRVYAWWSYEEPELVILGQGLRTLEMDGFGIGMMHSGGPWSAHLEFGICDPSINPRGLIQTEVVSRMLINHHGDHDFFRFTEMRVDQGLCSRIGITYQVIRNWHITAGYRYFKGDMDIDGWSWLDGSGNTRVPELGECDPTVCTWWQERGQLNYGAFEIGVMYRFNR